MIYQRNHVMITFAQKWLTTAQATLQKTWRAQCDRVSLYHYHAVLSYVEDEFQESEKLQIRTGLDSSGTAAIVKFSVSQFNQKAIFGDTEW